MAAWRDEQLVAGLSHATVRQRMAAVRAFAAWATRTGRVRIDDTLDLAAVQAPRSFGLRTPAFVSVEQLRLMDVAAGCAWLDDLLRAAQVRVILRVLGGCGLRVAELAAARLQDVVPARPVVAIAVLAGRRVEGWQLDVIDGKGGRDRTVRMTPSARRAIEVLHGQLATSSLMLVPALSGHRSARALARGVAVRTVQATIMRLAQHANRATRTAHAGASTDDGLADVVPLGCAHPHALRHGYALRYLSQDGTTLAGLSRALGHTAIATTARYLAAHEAALEPAPSDPWTH